jgi:hypothetical protein
VRQIWHLEEERISGSSSPRGDRDEREIHIRQFIVGAACEEHPAINWRACTDSTRDNLACPERPGFDSLTAIPKPVDSRDNGHGAKTYGNPIGVECEACRRRALVQLDRLGLRTIS